MKISEAIQLQENTPVVNSDGIGNVSINKDIDYFGLRVLMSPQIFLRLAAKAGHGKRSESVEYLVNAILSGEAVAPPFLNIEVPDSWVDDSAEDSGIAKVVGHEGRHRMMALAQVYGMNYPIEVHIIPKFYRRRHITSDWIDSLLYDGIEAQDSTNVIRKAFNLM